ncbi:DUF2304 family protein [Candidatus Woesearchaeota archaeon]|nr:DUF2304 family protein [Candidatus Woesearchaeota archaeon]
MQLIQVLGVVFALFLLVKTVQKFKQGKLKTSSFVFWSIIWALIIVVSILPWTTSLLARLLGVGRGVDIAVYGSIVLLFYLMFKIYLKLQRIDRTITSLVRKIAIEKKEKNEKKHVLSISKSL